ncbi:dual specificity protein phosphatase 22-A-like [Cyanistes caeruleus]|uniref:Dual specificity protein phosphatase 22-A-like n=1 Tax=Cyanistes caeruleus TaxID=156563 RepID=A0A8C0UGZ9_CYACU|nr:dual specificity protein phosphatase 22-A-like [Cyanistes caeruleus]
MGSGMSKIVTGLYLGNIRDSEDHENLLRKGVTHILSVHNHAKPVLEDMTYLCISASDSSTQNLLQHFKECIQFIHECRLAGGGCLVHCLAGVSRSSTILVAYLMTVTELGWESCLAATKAVRSYVSPNPGFQQQLQEYERTLLQEVRCPRIILEGFSSRRNSFECSSLPQLGFGNGIYYLGIWGFACKKTKRKLKKRKRLNVM